MAEKRGMKKTQRSRAVGKPSKPGNSDRPPERITQSGRFTPEQMQVVERACVIKGWSVARLIERATCEKAAAIVNVEEKDSSGFRFFARTLLDLLLNRELVAERGGQRLVPGESQPLIDPYDLALEEFDVKEVCVSLGLDGTSLEIAHSLDHWGATPNCAEDLRRFGLKVHLAQPEPEFLRDLRDLLVAAGSELAALLTSAYDDHRATRTKREFLDPQALLGKTDSVGPSPSDCSSDPSNTGEQP